MEKLTIQEEEAMLAIWKLNGGFVKEILQAIPHQDIPYTTLASTVKNLEKKEFVKGLKYANALRYEPIVSEVDYKKVHMGNIVQDYFQNSYKALVNFFVEENNLSAKELKEIIALIEQSKK
ncbi:transcriptional regulator [Taibaiella sp. KBW10]|uniref:BlaI/MecI/CopY family transcriptional regulator n=1 Tax=Taibaiella sp. KBW10 TaxID=2153357 RepID=UPI000F59B798|nr:BlaI/MecI/CopY family transcriptional regulator [Taibaiella sp. KBW10]RQO32254.1 transcriptional regulator [Taibaiella sp. KBW10]